MSIIERSRAWWRAKALAEKGGVVAMDEPSPLVCEAIETCRETGAQRLCGKPAVCIAYGDTPFCVECCYACTEEASPKERSAIVWLDGRDA